jgi:hypothetical protein
MARDPPEPSRPRLGIERHLVDQAGDIIEVVSSPHDKCIRLPTHKSRSGCQHPLGRCTLSGNLHESALTGNNAIVKVCTYHPAVETGNEAVVRMAFRPQVEKVVRTVPSNIWIGLLHLRRYCVGCSARLSNRRAREDSTSALAAVSTGLWSIGARGPQSRACRQGDGDHLIKFLACGTLGLACAIAAPAGGRCGLATSRTKRTQKIRLNQCIADPAPAMGKRGRAPERSQASGARDQAAVLRSVAATTRGRGNS